MRLVLKVTKTTHASSSRLNVGNRRENKNRSEYYYHLGSDAVQSRKSLPTFLFLFFLLLGSYPGLYSSTF
jgi:hypothetical protein